MAPFELLFFSQAVHNHDSVYAAKKVEVHYKNRTFFSKNWKLGRIKFVVRNYSNQDKQKLWHTLPHKHWTILLWKSRTNTIDAIFTQFLIRQNITLILEKENTLTESGITKFLFPDLELGICHCLFVNIMDDLISTDLIGSI